MTPNKATYVECKDDSSVGIVEGFLEAAGISPEEVHGVVADRDQHPTRMVVLMKNENILFVTIGYTHCAPSTETLQ